MSQGTKFYPVMEIFDSIQGEGCMLGMPVTFIRMAGCNLACPWCDTKESWPEQDGVMSIEEIVAKTTQHLVVITGGEPCLQDLVPLIDALHMAEGSHIVCLETNGTLATPENADWVVASPKPPEYVIHNQCFFNELKYVVSEEFELECIPPFTDIQPGTIWLQPESGDMKNSWERAYKLAMEHPSMLRVGVQLHKIMEVR